MTMLKRGQCRHCKRTVAATQSLGARTAEPIAVTHAARRGPRNCAGSRKPVVT